MNYISATRSIEAEIPQGIVVIWSLNNSFSLMVQNIPINTENKRNAWGLNQK